MNEIKRKRKELGLTQIQVANICGVSRRTYQTYEETTTINDTYDEILRVLDKINAEHILNIKVIKAISRDVFSRYPEVKCAYLYGSYARGDANSKSDVDILVVCDAMGLSFYGMAAKLKDLLGKDVDLQTHRQVLDNELFLKQLLKEGIKIYG